MHLGIAAAVACISMIGLSVAGEAWALVKTPTTIVAQGLGPALQQLAKERDVQLVYRSEVVGDRQTSGARGELTFEEALTQLLDGTGLTFQYLEDRAITIVPLVDAQQGQEPASGRQTQSRLEGTSENSNPEEIEEVVVTAQKREERLLDTPQSVTVLSSDALARLGAVQFRDFANTVPGLSFSSNGAGYTQISLRGVTTGFDLSPTVGIYVDEVPYGSSSAFTGATLFALDVGLFDLDRIEVLRGPQGTLYGASTMGGLLKYVSKQPDASRFGVDVQTGVSGTNEGSVSYNGSVVVNTPIVADKVALRANGFYSHDGGYIDNLTLDKEDINRSNVYGGRADVMLTPTEALSIRITGFMQGIARDGEGVADHTFSGEPLDGSLEQRRQFAEPFDQHFRLVSGTVTYDLGHTAVTSISSYQTVRSDAVADISAVYVPLMALFGRPYSAVGYNLGVGTDKFTQELRLASAGTKTFEWLIGGFYTREDAENEQSFFVRDLSGLPAPNDLFTFSAPSRYEEYAAFGDLTWHLTRQFDVSSGIRYARNEQVFTQTGSGLFGLSLPTTRSNEDVFTYLANARYRFSDRASGYLRYATGYRPGGPNFVVIDATTGLPVGPETFESDSLKSYEVGFKGESTDRRLGIDVAGYYIDWSNIIINVVRGGFSAIANAPGGATVEGAELAVTARPSRGLTVAGSFAYQDAKMSEASPDLGAAKGERLPNVPRFTAALNADYEFLAGSFQPTVGATLRHSSDRWTNFSGVPSQHYHLPEYTTVDLRASSALGSAKLQLYVHNLFDERSQLSLMSPQFGGRVAIVQPRTIGVSLTVHFD